MNDDNEIYQGVDLDNIADLVMIPEEEKKEPDIIYYSNDDKLINPDVSVIKSVDQLIYGIEHFDINQEMIHTEKNIYSMNIPNISNESYVKATEIPLIKGIDIIDTFTLPKKYKDREHELNNSDKLFIFWNKNYTKIGLLKGKIQLINKMIYDIDNLTPADQDKYDHLFDMYTDGNLRINPLKVYLYRSQLFLEKRELLKELLEYENMDRIIDF